MAEKAPEQEPSIEEILASIRQIISDDDEKPSVEPPPPAKPAPVVEEPVEDVLELTDPIVEEEEEVFEIDLHEVEEEPLPAPVPPPAPEPAMESILTDAARNATLASMAKLAGNMPVARHRDHGTITLEDLVREMLHPMLRDWLSESLPPMVERMVQKELEKLARQAQDV